MPKTFTFTGKNKIILKGEMLKKGDTITVHGTDVAELRLRSDMEEVGKKVEKKIEEKKDEKATNQNDDAK